jgi:CRP-like cAMP-binding protein
MIDLPWKKIALFSELDEAEIAKAKQIFELVSKPTHAFVLQEGELGDEMYVLVKGKVRITKSMVIKELNLPLLDTDNPRKVLATLSHESFPIFGEMALLDRDARSASVETLAASDFLVATQQRFFDLVEREPSLGSHLLTSLGRRLAATVRKNNSEIVKLTTALTLALSPAK